MAANCIRLLPGQRTLFGRLSSAAVHRFIDGTAAQKAAYGLTPILRVL